MKEEQDQGSPKSHQKFDDATTIQIAPSKHYLKKNIKTNLIF